MTFSTEWDDKYVTVHLKRPYHNDLIWLLENFTPGYQEKVLEFGLGFSASITYWIERGAQYYGIDGSKFCVEQAKADYPGIADHFHLGDFTKEQPFGTGFDIVFDRASVAHNDLPGIVSAMNLAYDALKPGGIFVGCDWFSTEHSEIARGIPVSDTTRTSYPDGQFHGCGRVHFFSHAEIDDLFHRFEGLFLRHRVTTIPPPNGGLMQSISNFYWKSHAYGYVPYHSAVWDIVARKPK